MACARVRSHAPLCLGWLLAACMFVAPLLSSCAPLYPSSNKVDSLEGNLNHDVKKPLPESIFAASEKTSSWKPPQFQTFQLQLSASQAHERAEGTVESGSIAFSEAEQINAPANSTDSVGEDRMIWLKAGAVTTIASASLIGVLPPILGWETLMDGPALTPSHNFFRLRGFTAGIMISLALVHIIAEAFEMLDGVAGDYPIAAIFIMVGVFIMILVERISMDVLSAKTANAEAQLHTIVCCHSPAHNHAHRPNHTCTHHTHKNSGTHELDQFLLRHESGCSIQSFAPTPRASQSEAPQPPPQASHCHAHGHGHSHGEPEEPVQSSASAEDVQRPIVMVSMLELGIVVHSVVIGMDLGVMTNNHSAMLGLVTALAFHQLFEGLGLGACVAAVRMHLTVKKMALIVTLFICTFPIGVAAGVALTFLHGFDEKEPLKVWLQGSLDAVSGGILLYVALVHFIAEDFSRTDVNRRENLWLRWQMIFAVMAGAATMALLALWV